MGRLDDKKQRKQLESVTLADLDRLMDMRWSELMRLQDRGASPSVLEHQYDLYLTALDDYCFKKREAR